MKYSTEMDRQYLVGCLKGQKMHVPDLCRIFTGWPSAFNPNLENLRQSVDERLARIVDNRYRHKSERALALKKLQAPNYALLGAYWWPFADERTLHTMTFMAIWIALWDDVFEVEAGSFEAGTLALDWEGAQSYRYQTLLFIRQCLQLPCVSYQQRPDSIFITSFEDVAEQVNAECSIEQKERLYTQLEQHVLATAERQRLRLCPQIPAVKEYLDARMASSGVQVCATLLEICQKTGLSLRIQDNPKVQTLLDQINIIILVTNDMCSLKSKIARGNVDNLVALLWLSHADLDAAMSIAATVLESAKNDFDATAEQLIADHLTDEEAHDDLEGIIGACRAVCTGNLVWSMSTRRYSVHLDESNNRRTIML